MSAVTEARHRYTYDEYLAFEYESPTKHEFVDGEIYAMLGSSLRHSALAVKVGAALENTRLSGGVVFQSDLKIRILATGRAAYPDVSMVCGPMELDRDDPYRRTITNPTLLVEVLSPSTEQVDRITKRHDYQLIPSLREYIMVSPQQPRLEIYRLNDSGDWEYLDIREGTLKLATGPTLDIAALYRDLPE